MVESTLPSLRQKVRLTAMDALRGLIIVVMALDHSRDFFGDLRISTENPETTTWPLFLTRWVTHFCAPTFVLLAGTSAWLFGQRNESKWGLASFLFTRGLWLLVLDHTVIYFALSLSIGILPWMFVVLSAIGTSMMILSVLCFLRTPVVFGLGLLICLGHNLLDPIEAESWGNLAWLWTLIHDGPGWIPALNLEVGYSFLPWTGLMCVGYGLAPLFQLPERKRSRILIIAGLCILVSFFFLRAVNGYGNPQPWSLIKKPTVVDLGTKTLRVDDVGTSENEVEVDYSRTAISFLRTNKYPPSLSYLLMTVGPALILLGYFDRMRFENPVVRFFCAFGGVPLFFYVIHFYLLHLGSIATYWMLRGVALSPFQTIYSSSPDDPPPPEYGFSTLWQIYLAWGIVVLFLFPFCVGYSRWKRNAKSKIWSYL